jgi:xanthine dehydrogenase YagS FAD-binding subunit
MNSFTFVQAPDVPSAVQLTQSNGSAKFIAGGTNLVDLMKFGVEQPAQLVDVNLLPLQKIEPLPDGGVRIGALVRNSDLAYDALIARKYPVLSLALLSGASPQLRNMATVGGNLLQRTRCPYFYDVACACNKRTPGAGCAALGGYNRSHAVLGVSEQCIATHPSDMCVALAALDAVVQVQGPRGARAIPIGDFHLLPGDTPHLETALAAGELITSVDLPSRPFFARSHYLKVRDRASYEFALASAAVALDIQAGIIRDSRIALGGVGTKPWRAGEAEIALKNQPANEASYRRAANEALHAAHPQKFNAFKIELAKRTLVRALTTAGGMS